jgi:hypothetical protein
MKKFLVLTFSIALLTGCGIAGKKDSGKTTNTSNSEKAAPPEARPPAVGDLVVAHWAGNTWSEGKVDSISSPRARIVWSDNAAPSDVDLVDIYQMPRTGASATARAGDYVITKRSAGTNWEGAQVAMVSPGVITVKYVSDLEDANLPPEKVIAVSAATAADIKANAASTEFIKKAQAHTPQAQAGYKPRVGDHVFAPWTSTSWFGGKVKSINGDKALIEWEGVKPDDVALDKIVPYPTAENSVTPAAGDYLLTKPNSGSWDYAQVSAVNGFEIEVKDAEGKTRTVKPGEFVILK